MPRKLPHPCATPGCPALTTDARCLDHHRLHRHAIEHAYDQARGSAASRGYDAGWRRLRRRVLAEEPLCRACLSMGRTTAASEVDHIISLRRGGTHERGNLQALCKPCHTAKTNTEDGGGWGGR